MVRYCVAPGCSNRDDDDYQGSVKKSFFNFPCKERRPHIYAKWLKRVNWNAEHPPKSNHDCVCADHFTPDCFSSSRRLKFDAVPSLFTLGPHQFTVLEESDESPYSSSTESRKSPHSCDEKGQSARQKRKVNF